MAKLEAQPSMELAFVSWAQSSSRGFEIDSQDSPSGIRRYTWALERLSTWNYRKLVIHNEMWNVTFGITNPWATELAIKVSIIMPGKHLPNIFFPAVLDQLFVYATTISVLARLTGQTFSYFLLCLFQHKWTPMAQRHCLWSRVPWLFSMSATNRSLLDISR